MTRSKKTCLLIFSILSIVFLILSTSIVGRFTIKGVEVDGIPRTWSAMSIVLSEKGRNILTVDRRRIKKEIENLLYVTSVSVSIENNTLRVNGLKPHSGVLLVDGTRTAFISDDNKGIVDSKDYYALKSSFLTIEVTPVLFNVIVESKDEKYSSLMATLSHAFESSGLITKAEYDNNNSSIFSGSLVVYLDDLEAILNIKDLRKIDKLEECIEIIREEYYSSKNRMIENPKEYVLEDSLMVVKR